MSTTATISRVIEQNDNGFKVESVYVRYDGHKVGETLKSCYNTEDKVIELISHGAIVSLGKMITYEPNSFPGCQYESTNFCKQVYNADCSKCCRAVCEFYYRNYGHDWNDCKPKIYTVKKLSDLRNINQEEYNYIFMDGKWYVRRDYSNRLKEV